MNTNIKIFLLCPIPDGQKPINEYINLKENFLTSWLTLKSEKYLLALSKFYLFFFFLSNFFLVIINFKTSLFQYFLGCFFLTNCFLFLFYFINFLRWKENEDHLSNSRVFYEEGSWYDGQIWEKPFLLIKNDRLLVKQKIQPILGRIKRTLVILSYLNIFLLLLSFY